MISDKKSVQIVVNLCEQYGIQNIVFSSGSRNAPLIISFNENSYFNCISIVDERSAAFYALGKAQQLKKPVIICCTSGSASLNYASAISEAYYQNIPLVVITADRPTKWLNNGEGQMINQINVFQNYIHHSFALPNEKLDNSTSQIEEIINTALSKAVCKSENTVHINFPFEEPLYNTISNQEAFQPTFTPNKIEKKAINDEKWKKITRKWLKTSKKLIICGILDKNKELNNLFQQINEDTSIVILTETTSNLTDLKFISCIDRTLASISEKELNEFAPELLITIGGAIISKKIKAFLRNNSSMEHWQIGTETQKIDTYDTLTEHIQLTPYRFFSKIQKLQPNSESNFSNKWLQKFFIAEQNHLNFIKGAKWSDLKVINTLLETIPDFSNLHLGNSSPVRYVQLFNPSNTIQYNSNRGVSGIDGCTSTMIGAASVNKSLTFLLSGDLSFVYDINALWNNYLTENIRIIVINNSGGGIFRFIPGPSNTNQLEEFFEVGNHVNIEHLVKAHNINYYTANDEISLENVLSYFYNPQKNNRPALLEIFTPNEVNPAVLKDYFKAIGS